MDPFRQVEDDQIWRALELANLKEFVTWLPEGLEFVFQEHGSNISVGQKQLICLARAALRTRKKVFLMDEATATVDPQTDQIIQKAIRREFRDSTVITIAHR